MDTTKIFDLAKGILETKEKEQSLEHQRWGLTRQLRKELDACYDNCRSSFLNQPGGPGIGYPGPSTLTIGKGNETLTLTFHPGMTDTGVSVTRIPLVTVPQ
jgi:hypothetical protein